jgi:mRNA-degrading endonuclease RelE of RelBE toxin-antitoxin system
VYDIFLVQRAATRLNRTTPEERKQIIRDAIASLAEDPRRSGSEEIGRRGENLFRIDTETDVIVYDVSDEIQRVTIYIIRARGIVVVRPTRSVVRSWFLKLIRRKE